MRKPTTLHTAARLLLALGTLLPGTLAVSEASAQQASRISPVSSQADGFLDRARQMWQLGNYSGVIDQARNALSLDDPTWDNALQAAPVAQRQEAMALMLRALFERGEEAEFLTLQEVYLSEYPSGPLSTEVRLLGADFFFFRGEFPEAVEAYSLIDISSLSPESASLYSYRLALSQVRCGLLQEASPALRQLERTSEYRDPARFYLAYIDYAEGKLDKARSGFQSVRQPVASELGTEFYLAQIDFREGNYSSVLSSGNQLLQAAAGTDWEGEINRLIGESLYNTGSPAKAEPYLRRYVASTSSPQLTALYDLGVISYDQGDYSEAKRHFSEVTKEGERLAQSSYLYLGQLAAKEGDYSAAAMSFRRAYDLGWDSKVAETALYDYVVASTKGGSIPFASSAAMLEEFVQKFPNSKYAEKVDEYLATAYFNDRNYTAALSHIERLRNPSRQAVASKQIILFQLGVQAFNRKDYDTSASYMSRCAELSNYDPSLGAQALLWQGDALYAAKNYRRASQAYERFASATRNGTENRALGLYNLGYSLYQEKKFSEAGKYFRQALKASPALPQRLEADCRLRAADCDYYNGNVSSAMKQYREIGEGSNGAESDYAAFQYANMLGVSGDYQGKIDALESMLKRFPSSEWKQDALLELTQAYIAAGDIAKAQSVASRMKKEAASAAPTRKAMLALAAARYDRGDTRQAISDYRSLVKQWPSSEEALQALTDLKTIYTQSGDIQEYLSFLDSVPAAPRPDAAEMEELSFRSAAKKLENNPADTEALSDYLAKFPNGANASQAMLLIAESLYDNGQNAEALRRLEELLSSRPDSREVPAALMLKAEILGDEGKSSEAADTWQKLLDCGGALYAPYALQGLIATSSSPDETIAYADRLLALSSADTDALADAALAKGKALRQKGLLEEALRSLSALASEPSTPQGAEAAVLSGEILLRQGRSAEAQKLLREFIDSDTDEQYWTARAYIALADALHAQGDDYNAREYLRALKANYPGSEADIAEMIQKRLANWK